MTHVDCIITNNDLIIILKDKHMQFLDGTLQCVYLLFIVCL